MSNQKEMQLEKLQSENHKLKAEIIYLKKENEKLSKRKANIFKRIFYYYVQKIGMINNFYVKSKLKKLRDADDSYRKLSSLNKHRRNITIIKKYYTESDDSSINEEQFLVTRKKYLYSKIYSVNDINNIILGVITGIISSIITLLLYQNDDNGQGVAYVVLEGISNSALRFFNTTIAGKLILIVAILMLIFIMCMVVIIPFISFLPVFYQLMKKDCFIVDEQKYELELVNKRINTLFPNNFSDGQ